MPSATANGGPERDSNPHASGFKPDVLRCTTKERSGLLLQKRNPRRTARRASAAGAAAQDLNLLAREGLPKELVRLLPWKRASGENGGRRDGPRASAGFEPATICPKGIGSTIELRSTVIPHCPGQGDAGGGNATRESGPCGQPDELTNCSTPR